MKKQLSSLTIFFPFFNDEGTVAQAIADSYRYGQQVTKDLEIIAIHGGASNDRTFAQIKAQKKKFPYLKIIDKTKNREGYAVIKYGLQTATKEWVFYTDGDLQYDVADLLQLVEAQRTTQADVINGYKLKRNDRWYRVLLGYGYKRMTQILFQLPIRDIDCDFRLIRTSLVQSVTLEAHNSAILLELIKKLQKAGATFAEIPVRHQKRRYGRSNYHSLNLTIEKICSDAVIWWKLL